MHIFTCFLVITMLKYALHKKQKHQQYEKKKGLQESTIAIGSFLSSSKEKQGLPKLTEKTIPV